RLPTRVGIRPSRESEGVGFKTRESQPTLRPTCPPLPRGEESVGRVQVGPRNYRDHPVLFDSGAAAHSRRPADGALSARRDGRGRGPHRQPQAEPDAQGGERQHPPVPPACRRRDGVGAAGRACPRRPARPGEDGRAPACRHPYGRPLRGVGGMSARSLLKDNRQTQRAIALIGIGARLQVLQSETDLPYERLLKLYKEVTGKSPSKGQLPFSTDWFMTWQPNIHASLFYNLYEYLIKTSAIDDIEAIIRAYKLYVAETEQAGIEPLLSSTRAWRLVRFVDAG